MRRHVAMRLSRSMESTARYGAWWNFFLGLSTCPIGRVHRPKRTQRQRGSQCSAIPCVWHCCLNPLQKHAPHQCRLRYVGWPIVNKLSTSRTASHALVGASFMRSSRRRVLGAEGACGLADRAARAAHETDVTCEAAGVCCSAAAAVLSKGKCRPAFPQPLPVRR